GPYHHANAGGRGCVDLPGAAASQEGGRLMYLTAQRVYSVTRKKTGINAFLYRHGAEVVPGMSWDRPVVETIADEHIGTRGPEHVEIAPGGNRVVSFVDIVAADGTPVERVEDAIRTFGANFPPERLPVSITLGTVAIRF